MPQIMQGNTALHAAARAGHENIVKLLLSDPRTDKYWQNCAGYSAFHFAAAHGKAKVIAVFLRFNTDYELPLNIEEKTVLDLVNGAKDSVPRIDAARI